MKNQSLQGILIEPAAAAGTSHSIPTEVAAALHGLLEPTNDPLDDEIVELAGTIENICQRMETLSREIRAIGDLASRLIEGRRSAAEMPSPSRIADLNGSGARVSIREREVLTLLIGGKSNREISRDLGISEKTVKNHLWKLYRKIGVRNRTQLFHRLICS
ncbi:MAG: helix-turn-helix transcriptional regulator [Candidatus Krumholzibacteria bacterium]|nr:helix-turn-helix transcriptional regulator [Candidatus Krumholzibacteria bacterium]